MINYLQFIDCTHDAEKHQDEAYSYRPTYSIKMKPTAT